MFIDVCWLKANYYTARPLIASEVNFRVLGRLRSRQTESGKLKEIAFARCETLCMN